VLVGPTDKQTLIPRFMMLLLLLLLLECNGRAATAHNGGRDGRPRLLHRILGEA